jgi:hypothetical protein
VEFGIASVNVTIAGVFIDVAGVEFVIADASGCIAGVKIDLHE